MDPALIVMAFYWCSKVDWEKTAVRDGFVLYDFRTFEASGLEKESIPAAKKIRGDDGAPSSLMLPAVPLFFSRWYVWGRILTHVDCLLCRRPAFESLTRILSTYGFLYYLNCTTVEAE